MKEKLGISGEAGDGGLSDGGLSDEDLAFLTWREVRGTARLVARLRVLTFPVMVVVVSLLWVLGAETWRLWVFGSVALCVVGFLVHDWIWLRRRDVSPWHVPYFIGVVLLLHTALITVTGGVESPFLVLYVVLGIVPAVTLGEWKPFLAMASVPALLIWGFTVGALLGWIPDLSGDLWGAPLRFRGNALYTLIQAGIFTLSMFVGGSVLLALRRAVGRTASSAARARWEHMREIRARNKELMALSGELAHELKNPLATIRGLSSLVARRLDSNTREKEQMEVLVGEVKRMAEILDQFLNFSRPLTGLTLGKIAPKELLAEVVSLHEGMARGRDVTLEVLPGEAGDPPQVVGDPRKVRQVLVNLLQNALEACAPGGTVRLGVSATPQGGVEFSVEDDGTGIAPEIRDRLFMPGFTTKEDGTGLGLTIARSMVQQHGGSLHVREGEQGGGVVRLTLPAEPEPEVGAELHKAPEDPHQPDDPAQRSQEPS